MDKELAGLLRQLKDRSIYDPVILDFVNAGQSEGLAPRVTLVKIVLALSEKCEAQGDRLFKYAQATGLNI